jgi:hypothetical protein
MSEGRTFLLNLEILIPKNSFFIGGVIQRYWVIDNAFRLVTLGTFLGLGE